MAQRNVPLRRTARLLARRFGLDSTWKVVGCCIVLMVALGCVGFMGVWHKTSLEIDRLEQTEENEPVENSETKQKADVLEPHKVLVHVDGAVANPGVYMVSSSSPRVNDAVELAGGITTDADTSSLNLAAPLEDGQKIHVPALGDEPSPVPAEDAGSSGVYAGTSAGSDSRRVNLNTASSEELQTLPGIGEATAAAIVEDRETIGPFSTAEDLMRVSGIGEKKFSKLKDLVYV